MKKEIVELNARRQTVIQRVMGWLNDDATRSQAQLAKTIVISSGALSQFLTGTYKAQSDKNIIEKLEAFFRMEDQRIDLLPEPNYVDTRQSKRIRNFISMIHISKGIGVLHGTSGIGKTKTIKDYMQDTPSVYYVPINPMIRTKTQFFLALAWTILGKSSVSNAGAMFDELAIKAATQGALIFVDDAHLLYTVKSTDDSAFEIIRTLSDRGIAFMVCGNGSLRDKVTQTNKAEFYQQLASRSKIMEIPHVFTEADVRSVIESCLNGKAYKKEVFQYLYDMANKFMGSLRLMVNTLQLASFNASSMNEQLTRSHLEIAASHVISVLKPEAKTKQKGKMNVQRQGTVDSDQESIDPKNQQASSAA